MATLEQRKALEHAKRALGFAREAYSDMLRKGVPANTLDRRWREYLVNWNSSFNQMKKAANKGATIGITSAANMMQRTDPVVQYLFQARDSDEHVGPVSVKRESFAVIGQNFIRFQGDGIANIVIKDTRGIPDVSGKFENGEFILISGDAGSIATNPASLDLISAENRSGTYSVPALETPDGRTFIELAKLGLAYLDRLNADISTAFD